MNISSTISLKTTIIIRQKSIYQSSYMFRPILRHIQSHTIKHIEQDII